MKLEHPEKSRTYFYENFTFKVENVIAVEVSKSGNHRIDCASGKKYIVVPGWYAIELDVAEWTF